MKTLSSNLSHKPIVIAEYETIDTYAGAGDAQYLSIGRATWNNIFGSSDFSAKVFRVTDNNEWSRQSEELPLWRVLDLAILILSVITDHDCYLHPHNVSTITNQDEAELKAFIKKKGAILDSRVKELHLLTSYFCNGRKKNPDRLQEIINQLEQMQDIEGQLQELEDELNSYPKKGLSNSDVTKIRKAKRLINEIRKENNYYDEKSEWDTLFPNGLEDDDFDVNDFFDRD